MVSSQFDVSSGVWVILLISENQRLNCRKFTHVLNTLRSQGTLVARP